MLAELSPAPTLREIGRLKDESDSIRVCSGVLDDFRGRRVCAIAAGEDRSVASPAGDSRIGSVLGNGAFVLRAGCIENHASGDG